MYGVYGANTGPIAGPGVGTGAGAGGTGSDGTASVLDDCAMCDRCCDCS